VYDDIWGIGEGAMKATRTFAITLIVIAAVGLAAWFGWAAFGPDATESAAREITYRNVSLTLPPEASELYVTADYAPPESAEKPGGGPVLVIRDESQARSGYMAIDANTGEVLVDSIGGALRDEADEVKESIRESTDSNAVWPVADVAAPRGREVRFGNINYVEPDPRSGIFVLQQEGSGREGAGVGLLIHNGQSRMAVSGLDGNIDMAHVTADDRDAFERLAAAIRVDPQ
jgi:hypothetical protein